MIVSQALSWWLTVPGAVIWAGIVATPWLAWSVRESLDVDAASQPVDPASVTVLIPARNEAEVIGRTLAALGRQNVPGLRVVVVDDSSTDGTAEEAEAQRGHLALEILRAAQLPSGWAGKLWALEQGRSRVRTPLTLLLDADIELAPGMLPTLLTFKARQQVQLVSLMAWLDARSVWEKMLLPAFVYFFKLLYPFRLSNSRFPGVAAAAGGCVLVDTAALAQIGGFAALRDALIDDCTLAKKIKQAGNRTWTGLTHSARSRRRQSDFASIHHMVARSAFTQLHYSTVLLLAVTAVFAAAFWLPAPLALIVSGTPRVIAALTWAAMTLSYLPLLRYYRQSALWALVMPVTATLYLAMTWSSAIRYWRGVRSSWKGRIYQKAA